MISYPQIWSRVMGVFAAQRTRPPVAEDSHAPDTHAPDTEEIVARASETATKRTDPPRPGRSSAR